MTRPPGTSGVTIDAAEHDDTSPAATAPQPSAPASRARLAFFVVWAVVALPLVVAMVRLAHRPWVPVLDLAQTEFRIRDITTRHPPLIGLPGRIGTFQRLGSHPGPLSFYALWPFYELFGASNWAQLAAASVLNILAIGAALWVALRRGGVALVVGLGTALALVTYFYGPSLLTQPWNPYMPMLWFVAFAMAVWAVLLEDFVPLWLVVFAGTFCAQTHISYEAVVGLLVVVTIVSLVRSWRRRRADPAQRAALFRAIVTAVVIGVLLWVPPIVQQFTGHPPNLSILRDYFTNPPEHVIGYHAGLDLVLLHLNPWSLIARRNITTGSIVPGVLVLLLWLGSVVIAWRKRARDVLALDLVIGASLVALLVSAARIFGYVWYYLTLWGWGVGALVLLATVWGYALLVDRQSPAMEQPARWWPVAVGAIGVVIVIAFVADATSVEPPESRIANPLRAMLPATERAIDHGTVAGGGRNGRYMITFNDTVHIGSQAYGLLLALERHGLRVGFPSPYRVIVRDRRVIDPPQATAQIHLSVGVDIPRWRRLPNVREVAHVDPRTPAEQREYARLRAQAIGELRAQHLDDLVPNVDNNLFQAVFDPRVKGILKQHLERMLDLGQPISIFVGPAGATA